MAFNKFDPYCPEAQEAPSTGERRAALLKWGWRITTLYTAFGFGLIVYWMLK